MDEGPSVNSKLERGIQYFVWLVLPSSSIWYSHSLRVFQSAPSRAGIWCEEAHSYCAKGRRREVQWRLMIWTNHLAKYTAQLWMNTPAVWKCANISRMLLDISTALHLYEPFRHIRLRNHREKTYALMQYLKISQMKPSPIASDSPVVVPAELILTPAIPPPIAWRESRATPTSFLFSILSQPPSPRL